MIYLDNAATTACDERVIDAMLPYFRTTYGNASSIDHVSGNIAKRAVDEAREIIGSFVGAHPEDVIFTSGSTEANNLMVSIDQPLIITNIEHPSISEPFELRARSGDDVLKVQANGTLDPALLRYHLSKKSGSCLISLIATNNEVGVEQDVNLLATIACERGAFMHLDGTQAVLSRSFSMRKLGIGAISLSAHKLYGPKGVGALIANSQIRRQLRPTFRGGGQERGYRPGTLNVPGIVGFAKAVSLLDSVADARRYLTQLRNHFLTVLKRESLDVVGETIDSDFTSPHISSLRFNRTSTRALLSAVNNDVSFSLGAACSTNKAEPSKVLLSLGITKSDIARTARMSFSVHQTMLEVERAATIIGAASSKLSEMSISA